MFPIGSVARFGIASIASTELNELRQSISHGRGGDSSCRRRIRRLTGYS